MKDILDLLNDWSGEGNNFGEYRKQITNEGQVIQIIFINGISSFKRLNNFIEYLRGDL